MHDRIYHRIAALDDGTTTFYLVSTDVCTISPAFYQTVCKRLEQTVGIKPEQFWWSTTHTHSAPHLGPQDLGPLFAATLGDRFSIQHDTSYWEWVTESLVNGIREAQSRLEPARIGIATGTAQANVNRRERKPDGRTVLGVNSDGAVDRQIGLIRLERPDRTLDRRSLPTTPSTAPHWEAATNTSVATSWDSRPNIVERKSGAPLLFINGAEGNVAPLYSVGSDINSPKLKELAALLSDRILAISGSIADTAGNVSLAIGNTVIETPRRAGLAWPDEMAEYASVSADGSPHVRVPVYTLTINRDTVLWAAPLELLQRNRTEHPGSFPLREHLLLRVDQRLPVVHAYEGRLCGRRLRAQRLAFHGSRGSRLHRRGDAVPAGIVPAVNYAGSFVR